MSRKFLTDIAVNGKVIATSDVQGSYGNFQYGAYMGNFQIDGVADPTDPQAAATKAYVDAQTGATGIGTGWEPVVAMGGFWMTLSPELAPTRLMQSPLTAVHTVLYSVPEGKLALVQRLVLANTALTPAEVSVSLVDTPVPGDLSNRIMHQVPVAAEGMVAFDMYQVVGGAIAASASPATVVLTASGSLFDAPVGTWDTANVTWDSLGALTWDDWVGVYPWDKYPAGTSWDSFPAGTTWDGMS